MLKRFPAYGRPRDAAPPPFPDSLRYLIVGRIHAGLLEPGARLPSIRELASRSGVDHRVAAEAYRELEREGLVEVRERSGVFVTRRLGPGVQGGGSWAAEVLHQGWRSGITRSSLCGLFGGTLSSRLRCACIESNEDHMAALEGEIRDALSLETVPVYLDAGGGAELAAREEVGQVDLLVTSVFHAREAHAAAAATGKPVAVLTLHRDFSTEIARRLAGGPVTAVISDPRYATMGRDFFAALGYAAEVRFVTVEEALAEEVDLASGSVLATRAARRRLRLEEYHLVRAPLISDESALALCEAVAAAAPRRRQRLRLESPSPAVAPVSLRAAAGSAPGPDVARVRREVEALLREDGLFGALRALNGTTGHRFTGIYRFERDWVRSIALFDRENPRLRAGTDVPMKETYCSLTPATGSFQVHDAPADPRLAEHPARDSVLSYCGVHLVDATGRPWGSLCHYDLHPSRAAPGSLAVLEAVRPIVQRAIESAVGRGARDN